MLQANKHKGAAESAAPLLNLRDIRTTECWIVAWIAGLLLAKLLSDVVMGTCLMAAILMAGLGVLGGICRFSRKRLICCATGYLLACAVWFGYTAFYVKPLLALDGVQQVCSGIVSDRRSYEGDRIRCTLRTKLAGVPATVYWYGTADGICRELDIGDQVTLDASVSVIASDYRYSTAAYAAGQGIYLAIYDGSVQAVRSTSRYGLKRVLRSYRAQCTEMIRRNMPEDSAALLLSMLFGDKNELSGEASAALYHTGIGHITAVSGLHLVFFCSLLGWILRRLRCSARWIFFGTVAAVLLFSVMVDSAVSVWRAACMLLLSQFAPLVGRYRDPLRALCIAMLCCTVLTPYVIGSVSFWLSVSGVFGITILAPAMSLQQKTQKHKSIHTLLQHVLLLCWVSVAVFPASVLLCGESSLLSPLANLLLIPLCTAVLMIGLLLVCTGGLTAFLLPLADVLCRLITAAATRLAALPFSHLAVSSLATKTVLVCGVLFVFLIAAASGQKRQIAASILAAAVLLGAQIGYQQAAESRQLRVAVLGCSDGMAMVCTADGAVCAVDFSGDAKNAAYMQTYLSENGIRHIDTLLLSSVQAAASYQRELAGLTVDTVVLLEKDGWRENASICEQIPVIPVENYAALPVGNGLLHAKPKQLEFSWNEIRILCLPADGKPAEGETYTMIVRYDGIPTAEDPCALFVATNDRAKAAFGRNTLFCFTENGMYSATKLS